jgi:ribosomal protein L25 (general stress protein Ctc)
MELEMSALITVEGNVRAESGKSYVRKLRKGGRIPAILKDKNATSNNKMVEINPKWLAKIYATPERTFLLDLGAEKTTVKITDVQIDKIKRIPIHVDLLSV